MVTLRQSTSYVQTGDFNGDGTTDLVVANWGDNSVNVLLGNGDGTFQPGVRYSVGSNPASVAVGDFNGDGILDLVVPNHSDNTVSVLLGNGDGTFNQQITYGTGTNGAAGPQWIAVADFNEDGIPDLAVAMLSGVPSPCITVLYGVGDGTFRFRGTYGIGQAAECVSSGDFNGDGKIDLAVTDYGGAIWILLGNGDGSFNVLAENVIYDHIPSLLAVGDFNGDGKADLAGTDPSNNYVRMLPGIGDGTFNPYGTTSLVGSNPGSLRVGDFNGDGILDLVVPNYNDNTVTLLVGNGDGTFKTQGKYPTTSNAGSLAVGDFNRDGLPDVAVVNVGTNTVGILTNEVTVTDTATQSAISIPGAGTHQVKAVYSGDSLFSGSESSTIAVTATRIPSTLARSANPASGSVFGQQVMLSATLSPSSEGTLTTNGETVSFLDGGNAIGTGVLSGGIATLSVSTLQPGSHSITASYSGDTNFKGSTSPVLTQQVNPAPLAALSSPSLNFGNEVINTTSASKTLELTNKGDATLNISSISA